MGVWHEVSNKMIDNLSIQMKSMPTTKAVLAISGNDMDHLNTEKLKSKIITYWGVEKRDRY
jgi:hypothetical protein